MNAVASRISLPGHVSRDDLLSCAHVALVEVARRFDPTAGASFATYALARLQGAVLDELRSGDWASRSVRAAARRTDAAADALTISLGRPPTREELAASLGVARTRPRHPAGRRPPRGDGEHRRRDRRRRRRPSTCPTPATPPSAPCCAASGPGTCTRRSAALPDRLDEVVERNFFGDESLTDIADDLGVTLSRVSQMRARALTLLHAAMSEVWEGTPSPADGGVRARNQQRAYVDRVAGRARRVRPPRGSPRRPLGWPTRPGRSGGAARPTGPPG